MHIEFLHSLRRPYCFVTGLRGPDNSRNTCLRLLKKHVTARLRTLLFEQHECPGDWRDSPMSEQDYERTRELLHTLVSNTREDVTVRDPALHFLEHLLDAIDEVRSDKMWGGYGDSLCRDIQECIHNLYNQ